MTLHELLAALERLGDGDWHILDVRSAEEAGDQAAREPGPRRRMAARARRPCPAGPGDGFEKTRTSWL
jgi:hypothetical protein